MSTQTVGQEFFVHGETLAGDERFLQEWIGLKQGEAHCFYEGFMFLVVRRIGRWVTVRSYDVSILQSEYLASKQ